jgi:hypothetical protein
VGVYLCDSAENPFGVSFDVKERISRSLCCSGIDAEPDLFDVKILNDAPFTFLKRVFVEGYWVISDSRLLSLVRENSPDFDTFIQAIRAYISTRAS